jgi:pimeloyl-ACP methyl ester carboxylesterase
VPRIEVDKLQLAFEEKGGGLPVILLHEFAGTMAAWEPQVQEFATDHRLIVYNCRGYPPSSGPAAALDYSQDLAVEDLRALMDALSIERATLIGLSMGGTTALNFAVRYPEHVSGLVIASAGSGSDDKPAFVAQLTSLADLLDTEGASVFATKFLEGPTRLQLLRKKPQVWKALRDQLASIPASTLSGTIRGVLLKRPTVYELEAKLRSLRIPATVLVGDEDNPVLRAAGFLVACLGRSDLVVFRNAGHTLNLEEPHKFNTVVRRFLVQHSI